MRNIPKEQNLFFYLPIKKCTNNEINSKTKSIDSRVERFNIELSDIYKFN